MNDYNYQRMEAIGNTMFLCLFQTILYMSAFTLSEKNPKTD